MPSKQNHMKATVILAGLFFIFASNSLFGQSTKGSFNPIGGEARPVEANVLLINKNGSVFGVLPDGTAIYVENAAALVKNGLVHIGQTVPVQAVANGTNGGPRYVIKADGVVYN